VEMASMLLCSNVIRQESCTACLTLYTFCMHEGLQTEASCTEQLIYLACGISQEGDAGVRHTFEWSYISHKGRQREPVIKGSEEQ
jgi:hypothetical protein